MATPEFILRLRERIGHDPLWLVGITAYVTEGPDGAGRVLLGRRADTGEWALVYGLNEPAEDPADTVVREVAEETGVDVVPTDLAAVRADARMVTYANGDRIQCLDMLYVCRPAPGGDAVPRVADEESLEVGWFEPDDLPEPLAASTRERMGVARRYLEAKAAGDARALFWCQAGGGTAADVGRDGA